MHTIRFFLMHIRHSSLLRLPVRTVSGTALGTVREFFVDADTLFVAHLVVRHVLHPRRTHSIARDQIVSVTDVEVVVADAVVRDAAPVVFLRAPTVAA
jgi:sporulation protein YlmC with PRC-barrel domain